MKKQLAISDADKKILLHLLNKYLPNTKAWAYGSRVTGKARPASDLDLVVFASREQSLQVGDLREAFEESDLTFRVDLFVWDSVPESFKATIEKEHVVLCDTVNEALQEHVRRYGKAIVGQATQKIDAPLWRKSTWGDEVRLEYGKALRNYDSGTGKFRVFGSNGPIGWTQVALANGPGVILGRKGAYRGVEYSQEPFFVIDTAYYVVPRTKADMRWLYYAIKHYKLGEIDDGSPIPSTTRAAVYTKDIVVPPFSEQELISRYLGVIDDRIQLLRETNATLEAMAQALFKSWFVDFDPVHAKAEGRTPEGMDAETAALFPAELEESELGMIPKGWKVASYAETVSILSGGTPRTNIPSYWNGNIPWFSVVDAPRQSDVFVIDTEKSITKSAIESSSAKILPAGTTIISARGTVGKLAITACQMSMNQSCYGLQGVYGDVYFTYFNTLRLVAELKCRTHGSVFDTITRSTFEGVTSIRPHSPMVVFFESSVSPLMERIKENLMLARTLTALRDTLLPRLISGKLRLPEFNEPTCEPTV